MQWYDPIEVFEGTVRLSKQPHGLVCYSEYIHANSYKHNLYYKGELVCRSHHFEQINLFIHEHTTHKTQKDRLLRKAVWNGMLHRCSPRASSRQRRNYYDAGVRVCPIWCDSFERMRDYLGEKPTDGHKYSLDRIDPYNHYMPGNVRWATTMQQAVNKRDQEVVHSTRYARWEYQGPRSFTWVHVDTKCVLTNHTVGTFVLTDASGVQINTYATFERAMRQHTQLFGSNSLRDHTLK